MNPATLPAGQATSPSDVARHVLQELGKHPLVEPLRSSGAELRVTDDGRSLSVAASARERQVTVRIDSAEWWVPRGAHWPERLAHRIAVQLRQEWDRAGARI